MVNKDYHKAYADIRGGSSGTGIKYNKCYTCVRTLNKNTCLLLIN